MGSNSGSQIAGFYDHAQRSTSKRHFDFGGGKWRQPADRELEKLHHAYFPATRVNFKSRAGDKLFLYYGNPRVSPPSYDLSLVATELMLADRSIATLAGEDQLKKDSWNVSGTAGSGGAIFWATLAAVVVVLLAVIARLLPKTPAA